MDSSRAPADAEEASTASSEITTAALEAMVTPEQVLSADVARKRRSLARRRPSRTRELTPARDVVLDTSEEEKPPPNVPERRRRKSKPASVERGDQVGERIEQNGLGAKKKNNGLGEVQRKNSLVDEPKRKGSLDDEPKRKNSLIDEPTRKGSLVDEPKRKDSLVDEPKAKGSLGDELQVKDGLVNELKRKDSLVDITQAEVVALFNKAKKGIVSGRERIKQIKSAKSASKRSQSVPNQSADVEDTNKLSQEVSPPPFTESQLLEGLRKAKLIETAQDEPYHKPQATTKERLNKPYRPVVQDYLKKRYAKPSPKVIEILDPKTSKVLRKITKGPPPPYIGFLGVLKLFFVFSPREIYRQYKAFKRQNPAECRKIRALRNRCISDIIIIVILCGLGGILFKNVEGAFENFYKCGVKRVKRDFIEVLWYRSHNLREDEWKSLARNKLRTFEEELHTAHEAGMRTYSGQRSWSFLNGVVYCLTVVTTIGYGHIYPTTNTGRALTIVYAIVGIPLFLIALTDFGKMFTRIIKFFWSFVRRLYYTGSCRRVRKTAHMEDFLQGAQMVYEIATLRRPSMFSAGNDNPEDPENPKKDGEASITVGTDTPTTPAPSNFEIDDEFNLPISVAIFILVLYIFLGALMYFTLEDQWGFFASFYFVFISMSTIGFGDMVPENTLCMVASIVYLVFGLALMSMCINVVQVKLSDTFKDASAKLGATIGLAMNEDDGSITTVTPAPVELPGVHVADEEDKKEDDKASAKKKSSLKARSSEEEKDDERKSTKEVKF